MNELRNAEKVLVDINELVHEKGYIYALCMILFEDFHIVPEELHEVNHYYRLSVKEAALLLGFLIQDEIDFATPDTPMDLIMLKQKTYELLYELHNSLMIPFFNRFQESMQKKHQIKDYKIERKEFFGKGDMLVEPIFYSGTGVYDFQYLGYLSRKYEYDKRWLLDNRNFDVKKSKNIAKQIKCILEKKSRKIHLYHLKEKMTQIIDDVKSRYPDEEYEKHIKEWTSMMELHQYIELFFDIKTDEINKSMNEIREEEWGVFYKGLIELFVIRKSDFDADSDIDSFLKNFSVIPQKGYNFQLQRIGDLNWFNAKPVIQLDEERYFVPISFTLFEAIYESPFYWMWEDKNYRNQLGENRGKVGEEISYEFLSQVFGKHRTFKSVKITTQKGKDATDIDVLCVLGSKALCVQVKSKKLTQLSRTGDNKQLQKDFQGAIQDAYNQGLVSRQKILDRSARFFNDSGKEIHLSENIDEVYIMGIIMENYPSLAHQSHIMLEKKDDDPFPLFSTIFDLELIVHYLSDPYDFLYYIRQRTSLMDYFVADEEIVFLGYHLEQKLWAIPEYGMYIINNDFGKLIDRNYYPLKAGLEISDEGDSIKNRWKNEYFVRLCNQLKSLNEPQITDIIFHLLDYSGQTIENIMKYIVQVKQKTLRDRKCHDFSMPPNDDDFLRIGISYISLNSGNLDELQEELLALCQARKYICKGDVWIGFGSLKTSNELIDTVVFNNQQWEYDEQMELSVKNVFRGMIKGRQIKITKEVGRNEKCPCGSMIKYKKCCGKNK